MRASITSSADDRVTTSSRLDRKKADKLQRIKVAALKYFQIKGFDDATIREIAKDAGVALGTIFNYAENKRDLLFLISNEDLREVLEEARRSVSDKRSMLENIVSIAECHFNYFAKQPKIFRYVLREIYLYNTGKQVHAFEEIRSELFSLFRGVVEDNIRDGIDKSESAEMVTGMIYAMYQAEVRKYLTDRNINPAAAKNRFATQIGILQTGLKPYQKSRQKRTAGRRTALAT
jgi:AcrR family transcriptional regulator